MVELTAKSRLTKVIRIFPLGYMNMSKIIHITLIFSLLLFIPPSGNSNKKERLEDQNSLCMDSFLFKQSFYSAVSAKICVHMGKVDGNWCNDFSNGKIRCDITYYRIPRGRLGGFAVKPTHAPHSVCMCTRVYVCVSMHTSSAGLL